jgi:hypothetical protein
MLAEADGPSWIAVDGTSVYFAEHAAVRKAPKEGGSIVTLASAPNGSAYAADGLVVDAQRVYWTTHHVAYAGGPLLAVDIAGGAVTPIVASANQNLPSGLAVDGSSVYWGDELTDTSGQLMRAPLSGGASAVLASGPQAAAFRLAVDATDLFYASEPWFAVVGRVPLDGSPATIVASSEPVGAFAADEANLYWWTVGEQPVLKTVPKVGGVPVVLVEGETAAPGIHSIGIGHIAVDESDVYWTFAGTYVLQDDKATTNNDGALYRVPKSGGVASIVAKGKSLWGVALDDQRVYWADYGSQVDGVYAGDGAIMSAPK